MKTLTQRDRIIKVLKDIKGGNIKAPSEYVLFHPEGTAISARYFKQVMLISECNARISEARDEGYDIETLPEKDKYGFAYHRLAGDGPRKKIYEYEPVFDEKGKQIAVREVCRMI